MPFLPEGAPNQPTKRNQTIGCLEVVHSMHLLRFLWGDQHLLHPTGTKHLWSSPLQSVAMLCSCILRGNVDVTQPLPV